MLTCCSELELKSGAKMQKEDLVDTFRQRNKLPLLTSRRSLQAIATRLTMSWLATSKHLVMTAISTSRLLGQIPEPNSHIKASLAPPGAPPRIRSSSV